MAWNEKFDVKYELLSSGPPPPRGSESGSIPLRTCEDDLQ